MSSTVSTVRIERAHLWKDQDQDPEKRSCRCGWDVSKAALCTALCTVLHAAAIVLEPHD